MESKGTILVTGGAKRIGKDICLTLADEGFDIALHYNTSQKDAESIRLNILKKNRCCELFSCDLMDVSSVKKLITSVTHMMPSLNGVINNASIFEKDELLNNTLDSLDKHYTINFKAPFIIMRDLAQWCKQENRKGHVINILDMIVTKHKSQHLSYTLFKKNLLELTKMAALELAPQLRVNAVAPGFILPPKNLDEFSANQRIKSIPLKQQGDVTNITSSIKFLMLNTYMTGQILFNDGGENLT